MINTKPIKLVRVRRQYRQQQGTYRTTYLALVNGNIRGTRPGYLWVHDLAGADNSGNNTYGAPYELRLKSNAAIQYRSNWKVKVATEDGIELITGMDEVELERIGYDTLQTNLLDPSRVFKLVEHLQNLQSFPNGDATVRVMPSTYKKTDGSYAIFGEFDIDILTGNVPSADNQVVVCMWLKTDNTIEITVSSEEPRSTDLKLDTDTAMTLINECAAASETGSIGIWSYIIWDDTTGLTGKNKFHDLRGIVGGGGSGGATSNAFFVLTEAEGSLPNAIVIPHLASSPDKPNGAGINEDYTGGSSSLTWNNAPASESVNGTIPNALYVESTTTTLHDGLRAWSPGSGAFEAWTHIALHTTSTASSNHVAFIISDSSSANMVRLAIIRNATASWVARAYTYTSSTYTVRGNDGSMGGVTLDAIFRITRDGSNNISFWVGGSFNGYTWQRIAVQSFTFTVAKIGYQIQGVSTVTTGLYSKFLRTTT